MTENHAVFRIRLVALLALTVIVLQGVALLDTTMAVRIVATETLLLIALGPA